MAKAKINGSEYNVNKSFEIKDGLFYIDGKLIGDNNLNNLEIILKENGIN